MKQMKEAIDTGKVTKTLGCLNTDGTARATINDTTCANISSIAPQARPRHAITTPSMAARHTRRETQPAPMTVEAFSVGAPSKTPPRIPMMKETMNRPKPKLITVGIEGFGPLAMPTPPAP
jgi:hypothetical protein